MPLSQPRYGRRIKDYPLWYYETLQKFMIADAPLVEMECKNEADAKYVRLNLYRFIGALRRQHDVFVAAGTYSEQSVECLNYVEAASKVRIAVQGRKVVVKLQPFVDPPNIETYDADLAAKLEAASRQVERIQREQLKSKE